MSFNTLPIEIHREILSFLDPCAQAISCRNINQLYHHLQSENMKKETAVNLFHFFSKKKLGRVSFSKLLSIWISCMGPQLRALDLSYGVTNEQLQLIAKLIMAYKCSQVEYLNLSSLDFSDEFLQESCINGLIGICPNVKKLDLMCRSSPTDFTLEQIYKSCIHLEIFKTSSHNYSCSGLLRFVDKSHKLTRLNIEDCCIENQLLAWLLVSGKYENLNVIGNKFDFFPLLNSKGDLSSLKKFKFCTESNRFERFESSDQIVKVAKKFTRLEELHIEDYGKVDKDDFALFLLNLPKIRIFKLINTYDLFEKMMTLTHWKIIKQVNDVVTFFKVSGNNIECL